MVRSPIKIRSAIFISKFWQVKLADFTGKGGSNLLHLGIRICSCRTFSCRGF